MKKKIEIHYTIEVDDSDFKKALVGAQEFRHGFADAGPIETMKRCLIDEGINGTFPPDKFDLRDCITRLDVTAARV